MQHLETDMAQLGNKELQAMESRYLGKSSKETAQELGLNESSVRRWFMSNGKLEAAYNRYVAQHQLKAQETVEAVVEKAKVDAVGAYGKIVGLSESGGEAAVYKSCEKILDIAGISAEASLENILRKCPNLEEAQMKIDKVFIAVFGKSFSFNETASPNLTTEDITRLEKIAADMTKLREKLELSECRQNWGKEQNS